MASYLAQHSPRIERLSHQCFQQMLDKYMFFDVVNTVLRGAGKPMPDGAGKVLVALVAV